MKQLCKCLPIAAAAAAMVAGAGTAFAEPAGTLVEKLSTSRPIVYTSGVAYAKGMKISRPGATSETGAPAGSFAIAANDGALASPGLGVNRLDWGAAVKDYSRADWRADIDTAAQTFSVSCGAPPDAPLKSAATCWARAYDYYGTMLSETHVALSPNASAPAVVTVTDPNGDGHIFYVLFGADQDVRDARTPGVDWGNFVIVYYVPL